MWSIYTNPIYFALPSYELFVPYLKEPFFIFVKLVEDLFENFDG
jgi:hypothetical protein